MRLFTFRNLRIAILLSLLALAAIYTGDQKLFSRSWYQPLAVTVFPLNADGTEAVSRYIAGLENRDFEAIDRFMAVQGRHHGVVAEAPTITELGSEIMARPPLPPKPGAGVLHSVWWSLKLRAWAFRHTPDDRSNKRRVRMFVLYHAPREDGVLSHSVGLQKGLIGVVHAYADPALSSRNNILLAHELLHTVGATDKYGEDGEPLYPEGYAVPEQSPRYPQTRAEIMAVRIPLSPTESRIPESLKALAVGDQTAQEINWVSGD